jgi:hypothetical protein
MLPSACMAALILRRSARENITRASHHAAPAAMRISVRFDYGNLFVVSLALRHKGRLRSFDVIKQHLGGFEDDDPQHPQPCHISGDHFRSED